MGDEIKDSTPLYADIRPSLRWVSRIVLAVIFPYLLWQSLIGLDQAVRMGDSFGSQFFWWASVIWCVGLGVTIYFDLGSDCVRWMFKHS